MNCLGHDPCHPRPASAGWLLSVRLGAQFRHSPPLVCRIVYSIFTIALPQCGATGRRQQAWLLRWDGVGCPQGILVPQGQPTQPRCIADRRLTRCTSSKTTMFQRQSLQTDRGRGWQTWNFPIPTVPLPARPTHPPGKYSKAAISPPTQISHDRGKHQAGHIPYSPAPGPAASCKAHGGSREPASCGVRPESSASVANSPTMSRHLADRECGAKSTGQTTT